MDDLAPARYHIAISNLGDACYPGANGVLDLTGAAGSRPYAVLVAPAGSIRGKLTGAARPADFVVVLVAADAVEGVEPLLVALPDAESKFTFGGLRPGHYRIAAQPAANPKARWVSDMAKMFDIEVPGGAPTELDLPAPVRR